MKLRWEVCDSNEARLYNEYDHRLATLVKSNGDTWDIEVVPYYIKGSYWILAKDIYDAMLGATRVLDMSCDRVIRPIQEFKGALPDLIEMCKDIDKRKDDSTNYCYRES